MKKNNAVAMVTKFYLLLKSCFKTTTITTKIVHLHIIKAHVAPNLKACVS